MSLSRYSGLVAVSHRRACPELVEGMAERVIKRPLKPGFDFEYARRDNMALEAPAIYLPATSKVPAQLMEEDMPKYLISASYTQEGMSGLLKEGGTSRRSTVTRLIKGMGGSLEAFYFAFGGDDVYVIFDMPDEVSATAISLAIGATGAVRLKTTVLISPEAIDEAAKKTVNYRAPGS